MMCPQRDRYCVTSFPLSALPDFIGTMKLSDCLPPVWHPPFSVGMSYSFVRGARLSPVDVCPRCQAWSALWPRSAMQFSPCRAARCCLPHQLRRRPTGITNFSRLNRFNDPTCLLSTLVRCHSVSMAKQIYHLCLRSTQISLTSRSVHMWIII